MSSRRVLGGIEIFIGAVRVAELKWPGDGTTWLYLPGHPEFEVPSVSEGLRHMHKSLKHLPPEGCEVSNFNRNKK